MQTSEGSKKNVHFVTTNGTIIGNEGKQVVSATTGLGQRCRFKLQVTDVHRPMMSVSRTRDAGHRVVFEVNSGYIHSVAIGEKVFTLVDPSRELFSNEDDDQEDSGRDLVFEGQGKAEDEAQRAVVFRDPGTPKSAEVAEHELTNLPHRSWCAACVEGDHVIGSTEGSMGKITSKSPLLCSTTASLVERAKKILCSSECERCWYQDAFRPRCAEEGDDREPRRYAADGGHRHAWPQDVASKQRRTTSTRRNSGRGEETEDRRNTVGTIRLQEMAGQMEC